MNLHQLRVFCNVAELNSFSAAAEKLHMTQPAVTLQIKNLEAYYQLRFFERVGKKVLLTEDGKVLNNIAIRILDLDRHAEEVIADLKGLTKGTLRISASYSIADYYLPAALNEFHKKYPKIFVHVSTGNTSQVIEETLLHKNDLAFVAAHPRCDKIVEREFVRDVFVAIIPNEHRLAARESITLNDLNGEPLLLREAGSSERKLIDQAFSNQGITPFVIMESASTAAIVKMVTAGAGIGILDQHVVQREIAANALQARAFIGDEMAHQFYLINHKDKHFSRALRAFVEVATDLAKRPDKIR